MCSFQPRGREALRTSLGVGRVSSGSLNLADEVLVEEELTNVALW